ncbi:MAG: fasciclin domain-containing protein [Pseudonocardia sp.]|nr:fasciclin domain-containing protein [Pseudonocardia sp.]
MSKIKRLAEVGVMVALTVAMSACGAPAPRGGAEATSSAPPPASTGHSDGVTTPAEAFGPMCAQLPQGPVSGSLTGMQSRPVATAAAANPELATLTSVLKSAGMVEQLNQEKTITMLAPYNAAFDEFKRMLGEQRFDALLQNKDALGNILKYHVIARRYDRVGLVQDERGLATLAGGTLKFQNADEVLTVTDGAGQVAHVLCGNIPTANATVFIIDKVLMPQKS